MEYNKEVTLKHPLASCAKKLNSLVKEDGGKGLFPDEYVALSVDQAEKDRGVGDRNKTMDIAIGTIRKGTSKRPKNQKVVMCEFRFNYDNPKNISQSDLEDKISHTRYLLQNEYLGNIYEKCYFLFSESVIDTAINYFQRMYANKSDNRVVITEAEMERLLRIEKK